MITEVWRTILEVAQRAPSPHNVQPWKVLITSEQTCEVYVDEARTLPKEDVTGSFITSGMVMYLEVMRYAAQTYQQDLQYDVLLDQPVNAAADPGYSAEAGQRRELRQPAGQPDPLTGIAAARLKGGRRPAQHAGAARLLLFPAGGSATAARNGRTLATAAPAP